MGGAICLLIHFKNPHFFKGAILIAPMCRISDKVRPRWPIPQILMAVARFAPTLPIVSTADLMEKSVKVPEKRVFTPNMSEEMTFQLHWPRIVDTCSTVPLSPPPEHPSLGPRAFPYSPGTRSRSTCKSGLISGQEVGSRTTIS